MARGLFVRGRQLIQEYATGEPDDRQVFYIQLPRGRFAAVRNSIDTAPEASGDLGALSAVLERLHSKVRASDFVVVAEGDIPLWVRLHLRGLRVISSDWPGIDRDLVMHNVFLPRNDSDSEDLRDAIVPASVEVPVIVGGTFQGLFSLLSDSMIRGGMVWLRVGLYEPFLSRPDILDPIHQQIRSQGFAIQAQELAPVIGEPTSFAHFLASKF